MVDHLFANLNPISNLDLDDDLDLDLENNSIEINTDAKHVF